jgi:hypothetical protein
MNDEIGNTPGYIQRVTGFRLACGASERGKRASSTAAEGPVGRGTLTELSGTSGFRDGPGPSGIFPQAGNRSSRREMTMVFIGILAESHLPTASPSSTLRATRANTLWIHRSVRAPVADVCYRWRKDYSLSGKLYRSVRVSPGKLE